MAYITELVGADAPAERPALENRTLWTSYAFAAKGGQTYRLRQIVSLVPKVTHAEPDFQAVRQVALARKRGFDALRVANQAAWVELWKGRIRLHGADPRWQALSDAALFYLFSSTHVASPASTSIFGLATWHDYHYYYGHVMWDIETFVVPVLSLLQPSCRGEPPRLSEPQPFEPLPALRDCAAEEDCNFHGKARRRRGRNAPRLPGSASWHEDHVSLDVARAFAFHADVSGDVEFLREKAWPVLSGVADWIVSRVTASERGYEIRAAMGIAERETEANNSAFTNMSAVVVLRDAIRAAEKLGRTARPEWARIADNIVLPRQGQVIVSHDDFQPDEEKGGTPIRSWDYTRSALTRSRRSRLRL